MSETGGPAKRIFGERYVIESRIARGGMADVFLARDQLLDRPVALKVLFPELSVDPSFVERFRREAQNAARLSHPNIVSVYDWGEDGNTYYIVMEYVSGRSLSTMLREDGPIDAQRAAVIGGEVASALAVAHREGVIHRDVKPGNVLIDQRGSVRVTDFGIARARNTTENLTQTGAVMGTATYFSPEQAQGLPVDQRSDVYSLGVVLYEMVAGKAPFTGDNPVTIAYKHVREQPVSLRTINPQVPAAYEAIVAEAMAKTPANRYPSADDLRADLERFRAGQAIKATALGPPLSSNRRDEDAYNDNMRTVAAPPLQRRVQNPPPRLPKDSKGILGPFLVFLGIVAVIGIGAILLLTNNLLTNDNKRASVQVPNVVDKPIAEAQSVLTAKNLQSTISREPSDSVKENLVIAQDPGANATAHERDTIRLHVSDGPKPFKLADYTGQPSDQATKAMQDLGLKVSVRQAPSGSVDQGKIIDQDPRVNATVTKDQTVTITVSSGKEQVTVPSVIGYTKNTAAQILSDAGLRTLAGEQDSDQPKDTVISMQPDPGTKVAKDSEVTIIVSTGNNGSNGNGNGNGNGDGTTTSTTSSAAGNLGDPFRRKRNSG